MMKMMIDEEDDEEDNEQDDEEDNEEENEEEEEDFEFAYFSVVNKLSFFMCGVADLFLQWHSCSLKNFTTWKKNLKWQTETLGSSQSGQMLI